MKKTILTAVFAVSLAGIANADQVIHVTGSTAFRTAFVGAVENLMNATGAYTVAYQSTATTAVAANDARGAGMCVVQGTITGASGVTTVKCAWAGSLGGVAALTEDLNIAQVPANPAVGWMSITNISGSPGTNGGTSNLFTSGNKTLKRWSSPSTTLDTATFPNETQKADATMSDTFQSSTPYSSPALLNATTGTSTPAPIGVVPFEFVVNNGSGFGGNTQYVVPITNITDKLAQVVFGSGATLAFFTGNTTDTLGVYGVGRNFDSGTRFAALAETGIGALNTVQQFSVTSATQSAAGTMTDFVLYPAETLFTGIAGLQRSYNAGESGYDSGGKVGNALAVKGSYNVAAADTLYGPGWLIGYLGRNDANTAVKKTDGNNTAHRLTYNGEADWTGTVVNANDAQVSTFNDDAVRTGKYSFWEFEHFFYRTSSLDSNNTIKTQQIGAINAIGTRIKNNDATLSGVSVGSMLVTKTAEGGLITLP